MSATTLHHVRAGGYDDLYPVNVQERLPFRGSTIPGRIDELAIVTTTKGDRYLVPVSDLVPVVHGETYWVNVHLNGAEVMVPFKNGITGEIIRLPAANRIKAANENSSDAYRKVRECAVLKEVNGSYFYL